MDHFSHLFAVQLYWWLKRLNIDEKEAWDGPFKIFVIVLLTHEDVCGVTVDQDDGLDDDDDAVGGEAHPQNWSCLKQEIIIFNITSTNASSISNVNRLILQ